MTFIPFTANTRMSGVDYNGAEIRKGAADAICTYVKKSGGACILMNARRLLNRIASHRAAHRLWLQRTIKSSVSFT